MWEDGIPTGAAAARAMKNFLEDVGDLISHYTPPSPHAFNCLNRIWGGGEGGSEFDNRIS